MHFLQKVRKAIIKKQDQCFEEVDNFEDLIPRNKSFPQITESLAEEIQDHFEEEMS